MATGKERLRELIENKESGKDRLRKLVGESTIESETQKYYDRASSILGNPVTPNEEKAEQRTTYNNPVVKTPTGIMRDSALTSRNEYGSRVGNTVKGALKQSAGSYGAAIGAMPALENELRKEAEMRSYSSILDEMEREYQTAKGLRKLQLAQDINYFAKKALEVEGGGAELLLDKSADLIESGNRDIEQAKEGLGGFGQFLVDTGAAGLQFGTDVALGALTGGASVPMFMRGLGGGLTQAQSEGATLPQAVGYGLLSGSVEALTEKLFAVSSLGKKLIGRGLADDAVEYELKKLAKSLAKSAEGRTLASDLIKIGAASGSEGIEEIISGVAEPILKNLVYTDGEQINVKDVLYQGLIGATLGLGGGLGGYAIDTYDRAKTNNALGEMTFESDALDDVIATGLESGTETESYRRAMELSARREAGQEISQKDVGALYSANVRAIEAERAQEALNRSQSDENVGEDVRDVVSRMGDNGAKALRTFYDGESDLNTYNAAFSRFYEAGVSNVPFERVNTEYARYISPGVRQAAYDAGRNDAKISLAQEKENAKFATVYGKSGGLIHNEASKSVDNSTMDALNTMLKAVGVKGKFVESIYGGNANGSYRNGIVEIALDSNNPFFVVAKHEITHHMQKVSPKEYRVYRDYVMGVIAKNDDVSVDTVVERYKNFAAQNDVTLTTEEAMDELAADFTENIIKDEKTLRQFVEENDRNVVQKFFDAIRDFLDKIKKAFKGNKAQMDKATKDAFGATVTELEKAEKFWKDMLKATQKVAQEKGDVASEAVELSDVNTAYSIRTKNPPKKTGIAYKVFYAKNGKLYPPMVANPNGEGTPMGVWLDADIGTSAAPSKTGRPQVKAGGKGTQGGSGTLAFRPGWHLGDIPKAVQFARLDPKTGKKELFPNNFVWAECEYAMDVDYQEEAMSYGYTDNGKFRHAYAGLPKIPTDGYYRYRTNPNPDTVPWIITGAMKVNRILSDEEVATICRENGVEPMPIQGGKTDFEKAGITPGDVSRSLKAKDKEYIDAINNGDMVKAQKMVDEAAWESGYVTRSRIKNSPEKVFHGTGNKFTVFDPLARTAHGKDFGNGFYFTTSREAAEWFSGNGTKYYNPETGEFDLEKETYVMGVYLDLRNAVTFNVEDYSKLDDLTRRAKKALGEYDGIIIDGIKDGTNETSTVFVVKDSNQIKSADPVTYDNDGNVIPLSKRFNKSDPDIRYSLKERDDEYLDALTSDTEKAQRMLDEVAREAGYTVKAYHGTKSDFNIFDAGRTGTNYMGWSATGKAFDFSLSEDDARMWGVNAIGNGKVRVIPVYLKADKTFYTYNGKVDESLASVLPKNLSKAKKEKIMSLGTRFKEYVSEELGLDYVSVLIEHGYDSETMYPGAENISVYSPNNIKSAELETYDDDGAIIPLSERFNESNPDIRYSLKAKDKEYMDAVNSGDMAKAQQMVDEAAKVAGYGLRGFHATFENFNVFDITKTSSTNARGRGHYFTTRFEDADKHYATVADDGKNDLDLKVEELANDIFVSYGHDFEDIYDNEYADDYNKAYEEAEKYYSKENARIVNAFIKLDNPVYVREGEFVSEALFDKQGNELFANSGDNFIYDSSIKTNPLAKMGYDGIIDETVSRKFNLPEGTIHYIVFDSNNIKDGSAITFDDNGNVIPLSERFKEDNPDIRYSLKDSNGNKITRAQAEYFKNSKVRDENGNLKVVYHGTPSSGFTVFRTSNGAYFTTDRKYARLYADNEEGIYEGYLNITKPFDTRNAKERRIFNNEFFMKWGNGTPLSDAGLPDWTDGDDLIEFLTDNGYDYDGIVISESNAGNYTEESYVALSPEQFKNRDNLNPTESPDIRFSLKKPVEETKNLIAIHNVRQDKLLEAIKLGGLPAPSIAITKNDMLHDNFGDISLVFSKDTISPTDRRNKIYSGDAWTPTRVSIEYDVDDYVVENFNNKIRELTPEWGAERLPSVDAGTADVENDSLAEAYKRRERARYAFLKEKGKAPKVVMREKGLAYYISNETVIAVAKAFTEKQLGDVANNISNGYEQYKNAILKVVRDNENARAEKLTNPKIKEMTLKQNAERFTSEGSSRMWIESVAREAIKVKRNKYKTPKELDVYSTKDLVEKKFTKKLEAEFKDWVDENTKGAIVNKGIRNNRDIFTPSGNRRSFKQLHDPYTLSNIVRNMFAEAEKGIGGFGGSPIGAAQHEYASIADVKADSGRLQKLDQSEYDAIEKEIIDDFYVLANKMVQNSDVFAIKDLLAEAIAKSTKQQADSYLKRESKGWAKYSPEFTDELWELKKRINSMPTGYFEAKPQRAVGFNEVLLAVIPKGNKELKKQLEEAGVRKVKYYDPNIEGDRLKKVNSEPDKTLFSLKGTHDIAKDNARLREYNEYLKGQLKITKVPNHDQKAINKLAGDLLKEYDSNVDRDELAKMLKGLYDYILEEGAGVDWAVLTETSREIAETILSDVTVLNDEVYQQYKDLRNYLKRTKIYIPEANRNDITDGYNEFRKRNFGRFTLSNDGTPIDTLYAKLADMHPELFDVEEYTTPGDQIMHIAEVLDSIKPVFENPYSYDMDVATEFLAREIINKYFDVPQTKPTFADKQAKKLEKQKHKDAQKLQAQKDKDAEKIAKIRADAQKRIDEAIKKEKAEKWKKVEEVKKAQRAKEARMSDRKKKSVLIAKIRRHTSTISKMLLNPTDTSHVPEALRVPVSEFLAMIDLSTDRLGDKAITRLDDLRLAYENIAKNGEIYMDVDPDLIDNIEQAKAAVQNLERISDMSLDDLEALYHATMAVERSIHTYNRVLSDRIKATITEYGEKAMTELATDKDFKGGAISNLLNIDMVAPADYFEELGGAFKELYADIRHGLDTKIRKTVIAREYIKDLLGNTDANDYLKAQTYKLGDKSITLTKSQVMSLYLLSKQEDAQEHIYIGGIKTAPIVEKKHGKTKIIRSYEKVNITPMELTEILGSMTDEEKRIADGIGKFFTDYTAEWGNEVSEKLYGYKKFTVKNYFPIVVDRNYLTTVFGETTDATLRNMGITKARVKGARNPVIIEDIFDVYARQVDQMSSYNAFVIPLMNIQRVYNYRTPDGSVKQAIQKKYGSKAQEYFANLMVDINGGVKYRGGSELMNKLISNYKRARVGANLRVIAQQPTALFRATAMIDPKYFVQTAHKKVNLDTVTKYAPIALWKEWGHFSMDTSRNTKDLILDNKYIGDTFMAGAKFADELAWKRIWAAAEAEVKDKHPDLKGEEFYMAVGERFSEVIDKTQVVDSVLHRPQILRTKSDLVKMSVSFMSEPMKSYNMLRTAIVKAKENPTEVAKKIVYKTFLAYFTSVTVNSVITGLIDALRGDEDDKFMLPIPWDDEDDELTFNERWFRHFLDNLANEPMSMIPYVKDVSSMMQGYTIERMDMAGVGDLLQACKRGLSDKYTLAFKVADISAKAMDVFGIPASSIKREVETATNLLLNTSGSPYMEYMVARVFYPISTNKGKYYDIMYEAWKMGDMKTYNLIKREMIEMGTDPSTIKGQMTRRKNEDN